VQYDGNAVGMLWNWCRYLDNKKDSDIMTSVITSVLFLPDAALTARCYPVPDKGFFFCLSLRSR